MKFPRPGTLCLLSCLATFLFSGRAEGTWELSPYTGDVSTSDADVHITAPGGTDLVYSGVSWDSDPLGGAPYYGARVCFRPGNQSAWGISLEFNHFKVISKRDREVPVAGTRDGVPVDSMELLSDSFGALDFSNGNNLILIGATYRWPTVNEKPLRWTDRAFLFAGASGGYSVPHANVIIGKSVTAEYQWAGPAWQLYLGTGIRASRHLAFFLQYKFSHSHLDVDLSLGPTMQVNPWSHHFTLGITLST